MRRSAPSFRRVSNNTGRSSLYGRRSGKVKSQWRLENANAPLVHRQRGSHFGALTKELLFLFFGKRYGGSVQVVISAYHVNRSGLNLLLQDRFGGAQTLYHIIYVRFDGRFHVRPASGLHRGPDGGHERVDVRGRFSVGIDSFLGRLDRAAALMAQNDDELSAQVLDRILNAGKGVIV